jgi:hypothetical protein
MSTDNDNRAAIHERLTAALAAQRPNPRFAAVLAARGIVVRPSVTDAEG